MELLAYYESHDITDFPKRTNGTPDMRSQQDECPICYEKIENGKVILKCKHIFCIDCFIKCIHQKNTCPMCRNPFTTRTFEPMDDDHIDDMVESMMTIHIWNTNNNNMNISEMVEYQLTHMSATNVKPTVDLIVDAMKHQCSMVALNVRNFFESQLF